MLFTGVKYIVSSSYPEHRQLELEKLLDANDATKVDLRQATHVITSSPQFEGSEKVSPDAAVVSDVWVERSVVFGKQQETKLFSPDPTMIFSGVIACTVDLDPCDKEVISAGINALGGLYREAFTRDCTHVLAARPGSDKYNAAMHFREATKVKVVLPHWFDDCFKLMMRLDETPYEWPEPYLLKSNGGEPGKVRITPEQKALMEASKLADSQDPAKIERLLGTKNDIWKGRTILLSKDLSLDKRRRETVEISIRRAGGQVISLDGKTDEEREEEEERGLDDADIYVAHHRYGAGYIKALRTNRTIGTLAWLFNVHKTGVISRPLDQLLHYPSPKEPPEGLSSHKITVSNYSGEARDYIKKLISLLDAEFTPTMTSANTAVIAAYLHGNKTDKAREWSIPVVNHTWLEDCFVAWKNLTPAHQKYIHYPEGINFGAMIGTRGIGQIHVAEEIEAIEAKMQEDGKRLAEEATKRELEERERREAARKEAEEKKTEEERERKRKEEEEEAKAEKKSMERERRVRAVQSPKAPRGTAASEREREASDAAEVDAAIDLANGDDSQPHESMDVDSPRPSRNATKKTTTKTNTGKKSATARKTEKDERPQNRAPTGRGKAVPARHSRRISSPDTNFEEEEEEEEEEEVASRPGPSKITKVSPSKAVKGRIIDSGDESDPRTSSAKRARGRTRKQHVVDLSSPSSSEVVVVVDNSNGSKGKGKVKTTDLDDIFPPLTDDGSPEPVQQKIQPPKGTKSKRLSRQSVLEEDDTSSIDAVRVTKVGPPRKATKSEGAASSPTKPSQGKRNGKAIDWTESIVVIAADGPSGTPKRGRTDDRDRSHSKEDADPVSQHPSYPMNGLQRTPSKRQAATMASLRLHETAQDMNKFQKEMRNGHIRGPWEKSKADKSTTESRKRRASTVSTAADVSDDEVQVVDPRETKKRKMDNGTSQPPPSSATKRARFNREVSAEDDGPPPKSKKGKKETIIELDDDITYTVMTTKVTLSDAVQKALKALGVKFTEKPAECNILITDGVGRTEKFLCALAVVHHVVTLKWAEDSARLKKILPPDDYAMDDPQGEKKYGLKLADVLTRARSSKEKLFQGHTFYVTPMIRDKLETYKKVATSAGAKVVTQVPTPRMLEGNDKRHVLSCPADSQVWRILAEEGFPIYSPEVLLMGVLRQRAEWNNRAHRLDENT